MAGLVANTVGTQGGGGSGGGTSSVDESNFTVAVTPGTPDMGVYNDALSAISSGLLAIARLTAYRARHVNLRDSSGNELGISSDPLYVQGSLSVAPVYSHTLNNGGQQTVGTSGVILLAQNLSRVGWRIQNIGTTVIYVLYGSGSISSSNYTFSLPAGGTAQDGSSPVIFDTQWQGEIQILSSATGGKVSYGEFV